MISAGKMLIRKDDRMKLVGQSLEISEVAEEDAGEYVCNVETHGAPLDQIHTLTVLGILLITLTDLSDSNCSQPKNFFVHRFVFNEIPNKKNL